MYHTDKLRFSYSSPLTPERTYDYDMTNRILSLLREQPILGHPQVTHKHYTCQQVNVVSDDKYEVPMTLVHNSRMKLNKHNPVMMLGYGKKQNERISNLF